MAVPALMYGNENWPLNRSNKRKIEAYCFNNFLQVEDTSKNSI